MYGVEWYPSFLILQAEERVILRITYIDTVIINTDASRIPNARLLQVAVDGEGVIYVSVLSPDPLDAYIYTYRDDGWETIGERAIGYLCAGEENIYFARIVKNITRFASTCFYLAAKYRQPFSQSAI